MAEENPQAGTGQAASTAQPVLHPGRPAAAPVHVPETEEGGGDEAVKTAGEPSGESEANNAETSTDEAPSTESQRHRWRVLLRQCERVLLVEFDRLSMPDWPDNYSVLEARRRRDLWLFSAVVSGVLFLAGVPGFVPAWVAGTGFGVMVIILLAGVPLIRRLYSSRPTYLELILKRQQRLREARAHVEHLEGDEGLAWQCAQMAEFNPALRATRFGPLVDRSEQRRLARSLRRREHFRLYLIFMIEAEKAYERLQNAYLSAHQRAIDETERATDKDGAAESVKVSRDSDSASSSGEDESSATRTGKAPGATP